CRTCAGDAAARAVGCDRTCGTCSVYVVGVAGHFRLGIRRPEPAHALAAVCHRSCLSLVCAASEPDRADRLVVDPDATWPVVGAGPGHSPDDRGLPAAARNIDPPRRATAAIVWPQAGAIREHSPLAWRQQTASWRISGWHGAIASPATAGWQSQSHRRPCNT